MPGFSTKYGKQQAVVNEDAIKSQENYLKQFFQHINPYTKLTYKDDPDVIATELNNEPHHSGSKEKTTEYVNRLATAVRSTGWTKPIFYNIKSQPHLTLQLQVITPWNGFAATPTQAKKNIQLLINSLPLILYFIPNSAYFWG